MTNVKKNHVRRICVCLLVLVTVLIPVVETASPPNNNYTVKNGETTCIVMTTGIQLNVPYSSTLQNYTSIFNVDTNATNTGVCDDSMDFESLIIRFSEDWELSFIFGRSTDTSTNSSYFYINQVNFTYTLDAEHFPNLSANYSSVQNVLTVLPNDTLQASTSGSYKCRTNNILNLNNGIILRLFNLQYRAFGTDNSTGFSDTGMSVCQGEENFLPESDVQVAIAVGIALATMMAIIIVLYLIASKAKGKDAEE